MYHVIQMDLWGALCIYPGLCQARPLLQLVSHKTQKQLVILAFIALGLIVAVAI